MSADHGFLIRQIATGDKRAFAALYRDLETPTLRFIRSRLNDPFEANDILHDVFMEVWRSAAKFEGKSMVRTWIFGIAYRKVIDSFRKRKRIDTGVEIPDLPDPADSAETILNADQEAGHLNYCINELSTEHRLAISLAFYEDMSYDEIAEVAGVPAGTIKSRVFHAKKNLLECMKTRVARQAV
jgi:RNA polymerase sigma-70 factor, ECF subfamily